MNTNTKNYVCDNLDEVAKILGVDLSGYPMHSPESKDRDELFDALLNKFGMYSGVLELVEVEPVPTLDEDCYYKVAVSPEYYNLEAIA